MGFSYIFLSSCQPRIKVLNIVLLYTFYGDIRKARSRLIKNRNLYKHLDSEILQESKYSNHAILDFQYLEKTNMVSRDIKESRKENDGQR